MSQFDGLRGLLDRFSEAQARFDAAPKGSAERAVAAREERALRGAIGDVAVALLPDLLAELLVLDTVWRETVARVERLESIIDQHTHTDENGAVL